MEFLPEIGPLCRSRRIRNEQTTTAEPQPGFQGESGHCGDQGRVGAAGTAELAQQFDVHANQITEWRRQLLEGAANVFGAAPTSEPPIDVKALHAKIGELTLANDFLGSALGKVGWPGSARR